MPVVTLIHKTTVHFEVPEGMTFKELEEAVAELSRVEDIQAATNALIEDARQDIEYAYNGVLESPVRIKTLTTFTDHSLHEGYKES